MPTVRRQAGSASAREVTAAGRLTVASAGTQGDAHPCLAEALRGMTLGRLCAMLAAGYGWTRRFDFADPARTARFWYVSEEKLEPRLGERATDAGQEREQPLGIARSVADLAAALEGWDQTRARGSAADRPGTSRPAGAAGPADHRATFGPVAAGCGAAGGDND